MAHLHKLNKTVRASLAAQIAARATPATRTALSAGHHIRLAEDFQVWHLLDKAIKSAKGSDARLSKFAEPTGYWQHLVRHGGEAVEIASSKREGTGRKWKIHSLFTSPLAKRFARVIEWTDRHDDSDAVVRLLIVPKFGLHTLWLDTEDSDQVVLIDAMKPISALKPDVFYSGPDFVEILSKEKITPMPPLTGAALQISRQIHSGNPFTHEQRTRNRLKSDR